MAGGTAQRLAPPRIGIIGATSLVGESLLANLTKQQCLALALTRRQPPVNGLADSQIEWHQISNASASVSALSNRSPIEHWVLLAPIWVMPDYFEMLEQLGARSIVALSSTSVITKRNSKDTAEQSTIIRMLQAEQALEEWATRAGIRWAILRPTLIYGRGADKNLSEIARIIRKTHIFPLLGPANGKRQPVHVDDVASACLAALTRSDSAQSIYSLSGQEVLPYHEMVRRVFIALDMTPRFIRIPASFFELAVKAMQMLPRYRSWTPSMAERMNLDMAFSHAEAQRDFGYQPRSFTLSRSDLP